MTTNHNVALHVVFAYQLCKSENLIENTIEDRQTENSDL